MKIKSSMRVCDSFSHVFSCGDCELQNILPRSVFDPVYYNAGMYGWSNDMYVDYLHDAIITTGCRNLRGVPIPRKALDFYGKRAAHIENLSRDSKITWEEMREMYYKNFQDMVKYLIAWEEHPDVLPCEEN